MVASSIPGSSACLSGPELREGIVGARILICKDYEFELIRQKTVMEENEVLDVADVLLVTCEEGGLLGPRGSRGCHN